MLIQNNSSNCSRFDKKIQSIIKLKIRVVRLLVVSLTVVAILLSALDAFRLFIFDQSSEILDNIIYWIGINIFLISGVYVMYFRKHMRILYLYYSVPSSTRIIFAKIGFAVILAYTLLMVIGGIFPAWNSFLSWEQSESLSNLPIPAITMLMILLTTILTALSAYINLQRDCRRNFYTNNTSRFRFLIKRNFGVLLGISLSLILTVFLLTDYHIEVNSLILAVIVIVGLVSLILIGTPFGFATGFLGASVYLIFHNGDNLRLIIDQIYHVISGYVVVGSTTETINLVVIPFYIAIVTLISNSKIPKDLFQALNIVSANLKFKFIFSTISLSLILATVFGVVSDAVNQIRKLALPLLRRDNCNKHVPLGTILVGGTLPIVFPVSVILIIIHQKYETIFLSDLLAKALYSGLILVTFFIIYAVTASFVVKEKRPIRLKSDLVQTYRVKKFDCVLSVLPIVFGLFCLVVGLFSNTELHRLTTIFFASSSVAAILIIGWIYKQNNFKISRGLLPPYVLVCLVFGSIYTQIDFVTQATTIGIVATILMLALRGEFNCNQFFKGINSTITSIGKEFWLAFGVAVLLSTLKLMGVLTEIVDFFSMSSSLSKFELFPILMILLILSLLLNWLSVLLLILPIFIPIVTKLNFDLGWFVILFCLVTQMSYLLKSSGIFTADKNRIKTIEKRKLRVFISIFPIIVIQILVMFGIVLLN